MSYVRVWIHAVWGTKNEYYAVSVSESVLGTVRAYIHNQEEHHKKRTYVEEVEVFLQKYNFSHHG